MKYYSNIKVHRGNRNFCICALLENIENGRIIVQHTIISVTQLRKSYLNWRNMPKSNVNDLHKLPHRQKSHYWKTGNSQSEMNVVVVVVIGVVM